MFLPDHTMLRNGAYEIIRNIGRGGFGCTYKARQATLERIVCIKEFFPSVAFCDRDNDTHRICVTDVNVNDFDALKTKFLKEAKTLCDLHHPGMVNVIDIFEDYGTVYFVMDYIEGTSVQQFVESNGPMSEADALQIISQVCQALEYVHSCNVLHLDIKPDNIMLTSDGRAKVIDFGVAKRYSLDDGSNNSIVAGESPGYSAIEQVNNDIRYFSPATDVYSLGATLYYMLTGEKPKSSAELACGHELSPLPATVSEATANAIHAAMQLRREMRPPMVRDFANMLFDPTPAQSAAPAQHTVVNIQPRQGSQQPAQQPQYQQPQPQYQQQQQYQQPQPQYQQPQPQYQQPQPQYQQPQPQYQQPQPQYSENEPEKKKDFVPLLIGAAVLVVGIIILMIVLP